MLKTRYDCIMRSLYQTTRLILLFCLAIGAVLIQSVTPTLAQSDTGYGLSGTIQTRISGQETDYVQMVRVKAPEFSLLRKVETLPPLSGRTIDVPITLLAGEQAKVNRPNSPPVIATLHDRRSGRPLDSCEAPCTLKSPMMPPGMVTLYRYGTKPLNIGAEHYAFKTEVDPLFLGFNEVDHQIERDRCAKEFAVLRRGEVERDAEACVRVPPRMPEDAMRSGHCLVNFNVSENGEPVDVRADECTEQVFCEPTTEAVRRWIYYPRLQYAETAFRSGVRSTIRFRLTNFRGAVIPEGEVEMQPCVGSA